MKNRIPGETDWDCHSPWEIGEPGQILGLVSLVVSNSWSFEFRSWWRGSFCQENAKERCLGLIVLDGLLRAGVVADWDLDVGIWNLAGMARILKGFADFKLGSMFPGIHSDCITLSLKGWIDLDFVDKSWTDLFGTGPKRSSCCFCGFRVRGDWDHFHTQIWTISWYV